jgi:VWFA-related protein
MAWPFQHDNQQELECVRMRRLLLVGLVAIGTWPAFAAHRVKVSELEEKLSADLDKHRSDEEIARQLGDVQLTERLTRAALDRLAAKLRQFPHTALALELLADDSAVFDPPRSELPGTVPPDMATQQRILQAARAYVIETIPRLPNFFATRTTVRFDDTAQVLRPGEWPIRAGFHLVGTSARVVTVRDGQEVTDSVQDARSKAEGVMGLYSFGEFGPILVRTLADVGNGKLQFSHWETSPLGVAAVFRYAVPRHESHYQVHFCCLSETEIQGGGGTLRPAPNRPGASAPNRLPVEDKGQRAYDTTPAYRGTLTIDPASGAIVRMTIDADLDPDNPITRAATIVEYSRVAIGDQAFVCPVRSLAISSQQGGLSLNGEPHGPPIVSINETTFTHYRRLGSSARLIADGSVPPGGAAPGQAGASGQTGKEWVAGASLQSGAATPPAAPQQAEAPTGGGAPADPAKADSAQKSDETREVASSQPINPLPPPAEPVIPEMSTSAANGIPDIPSGPPSAQDSGYTLKITSRLVDVNVVASDKKGRPVTDLKPEDFEIYDDGRKQEIRSFAAPPSGQPQTAAAPATPEGSRPATFSNRASAPATGAAEPPAEDGTILLLDESHIAWNDLNNARGQMIKFLAALPAGQRVGLYTMTGLGFRVLVEMSADHGAVAARLNAFLPTAQSINEAQEEERRNRQQFSTVHNVADLNSVNGNHTDVPDAEQPVDPELLTMGSSPARSALIILAQVARHLASIPGHKNLVWVASDNVLADWQDQAVGIDKSPKAIDSFEARAREAMNDAHAAIYPFDVSQLEAGGVTADLQHANVQLSQAAAENAATAASAGAAGGGATSNRDTGMGRISAQMSQDLHPIQGPVRELAEATGGRAIRRAGDLAAELSGIVRDGRATYQMSFSPQGPADDRYHALTVKLNGRRDVRLRYRTGYLFDREPVSLKERFRQAVWRPTETSEIGVTASVTAAGGNPAITLNIAAADLGMQQQAGHWMDKLDIFFIQRDDAGIRAQLDGQVLGLRLKPETYQKAMSDGIPFNRSLEMRAGMASVRVLVVDENSGHMGSVTIPASALQAGK